MRLQSRVIAEVRGRFQLPHKNLIISLVPSMCNFDAQ